MASDLRYRHNMRVPEDPEQPTFDHTFRVGFLRWVTSSKTDRLEWARRRNLAAELAQETQQARVEEWRDRKIAEAETRKQAQD